MEENDLRERGINSLRIFLNKEQNIKIIEKNMYDLSKNYLLDLYETINDINIGTKLNNILHDIKNCKIGWKHNSFKDLIFEEEEQNNFIIQPFEVYEGVLICNCGSKRVYSYQKQSRSADEPMSTYANCMACGNKWVYSG